MQRSSRSSTSSIENETEAEPEDELETETEAELKAKVEAESKAEAEARGDYNSKSSTSTPPAVEESPAQISDNIRRAVDLVDGCCLQASTGYIQEFREEFQNREEKNYDTELGRRCFRIYNEKRAPESLRTNTGIICDIIQIQAESIALLMTSEMVVDLGIKKLRESAERIETAQEVFKSPKVDNEDSRLRAVFVSGILYCQRLHREDMVGRIQAAAEQFHERKFVITEA
ncbi:hypothetical protein FAVG1_02065 [Fusarium avenaceum]|nr:hypothetical protein FAVG1_02065 [Fusarium avenaceum]